MTSHPVGLRHVSQEDAAGIAAVYRAAWPLSVDHRATRVLIDELLALRGTVDYWQVQIADPALTFAVAVSDAVVTGFATWTSPDGPDADPELVRLFTLPAIHGSGVAGQLHDHAVAAITATGAPRMHLWSVIGNARAEAFYLRRGWTPTEQVIWVPSASGSLPGRRWIRTPTPA